MYSWVTDTTSRLHLTSREQVSWHDFAHLYQSFQTPWVHDSSNPTHRVLREVEWYTSFPTRPIVIDLELGFWYDDKSVRTRTNSLLQTQRVQVEESSCRKSASGGWRGPFGFGSDNITHRRLGQYRLPVFTIELWFHQISPYFNFDRGVFFNQEQNWNDGLKSRFPLSSVQILWIPSGKVFSYHSLFLPQVPFYSMILPCGCTLCVRFSFVYSVFNCSVSTSTYFGNPLEYLFINIYTFSFISSY